MHPPGYHKTEAAKKRCWGCSSPGAFSYDQKTAKAMSLLVKQGWEQFSRKHRMIGLVINPSHPRTADNARETRILSPSEFAAWVAVGGNPFSHKRAEIS